MNTLENIQARIQKLQARAETLLAKQAQAAVNQIRELMLKHGLTTADIEAKAKAKREAKASGRTIVSRGVKASSPSKGKLPAKYLNPTTGETWSGHARPPAWIKDVKDRTKFLIDGAITAAPTKKVSGSGVKTSAKKAQTKGAQPAKYRDPKSGATWSGRGPAPKWLASAKDRTKFLVEQASAVKSDASATRSATKSKAARTASSVSKKVGTAKTAKPAKKAAVAKKAPTKASAKAAGAAKKAPARKTTAREVAPATTATTATTATPEIISTESV